MLRTREIIKDLSYDKLVEEGIIVDIIPPIEQHENSMSVKRYPPFVYGASSDQKFSCFGYLLEYLIRAGLRIKLNQKIENNIDPVNDKIQLLSDEEMISAIENISIYESSTNMNDIIVAAYNIVNILYSKSIFDADDIKRYLPTAINVIKEIVSKWSDYQEYLSGTIKYNTEYTTDHFSGHPDIVTDLTVLDVKNTASFRKMSKESSLQILSYYALIKQTNPEIKYGGLILPMQRELVLIDLSDWDSRPYLDLLNTVAINKLPAKLILPNNNNNSDGNRNNNTDDIINLISNDNTTIIMLSYENDNTIQNIMNILNPFGKYKIGNHVAKGTNIITTFKNFIEKRPGVPVQMFLRNPRTGKCNAKTNNQITSAAKVIQSNNLLYFTHAPYVINLCTNQHDKENYWAQEYLNEDLKTTVLLGGRGVVVHTGARKKLGLQDATDTMELMVREALQYATEQCPLLLETPCSEGTEIVTTLEELGEFFMKFNDDERKRLGLCCDICHLFSAGYNPLEYMKDWYIKYPNIDIKLVHFNDSAAKIGARVDRHAYPGQGYIGLETMLAIAEWCTLKSIPMVVE